MQGLEKGAGRFTQSAPELHGAAQTDGTGTIATG